MATAAPSSPGLVDDVTVARFRGGDRQAFLAVHDACAPIIRALVGRYFASPFEREEATQEIWLHAHRMAAAYDPARGPLLPWLRALAGNRCKELLRARGRRPDARVELDDDGGGGEPGEPAAGSGAATAATATASPEAAARLGRLRAAVARFSSGLTEEEGAVLRLSLLEERTHDEVAALTGSSPRRCKYLRAKLLERAAAHAELRAALEEVIEP